MTPMYIMGIVVKSNIKKTVSELQRTKSSQSPSTSGERNKESEITSIAEEVGTALERKVEDILLKAIERAKANKRRTLQARDL